MNEITFIPTQEIIYFKCPLGMPYTLKSSEPGLLRQQPSAPLDTIGKSVVCTFSALHPITSTLAQLAYLNLSVIYKKWNIIRICNQD